MATAGNAPASSAGLIAVLGGWLQLARVSNLPTVFTNAFAGAAIARFDLTTASVLQSGVAISFLYMAGMMLNDLCDFKVDCDERPERPLPSGLISIGAVRVAVVLLMSVGALGMWWISDRDLSVLMLTFILVGLIVLYDCWHKENGFSSLIMGACRAMVYIVVFCLFEPFYLKSLLFPCCVMILYICGITLLARQEASNRTIRWPLGLLFLPILFPVLNGYLPWGFGATVPDWTLVGLFGCLFAGWTLFAIRPMVVSEGRRVGVGIGRLLAGIALMDGLIVASYADFDFQINDGMLANLSALIGLAGPVGCVLLFALTVVLQRNIKAS